VVPFVCGMHSLSGCGQRLRKSGQRFFIEADQFAGTPLVDLLCPPGVGEQGAAYCHQVKISENERVMGAMTIRFLSSSDFNRNG
jgi:hypothetical protein